MNTILIRRNWEIGTKIKPADPSSKKRRCRRVNRRKRKGGRDHPFQTQLQPMVHDNTPPPRRNLKRRNDPPLNLLSHRLSSIFNPAQFQPPCTRGCFRNLGRGGGRGETGEQNRKGETGKTNREGGGGGGGGKRRRQSVLDIGSSLLPRIRSVV